MDIHGCPIAARREGSLKEIQLLLHAENNKHSRACWPQGGMVTKYSTNSNEATSRLPALPNYVHATCIRSTESAVTSTAQVERYRRVSSLPNGRHGEAFFSRFEPLLLLRMQVSAAAAK